MEANYHILNIYNSIEEFGRVHNPVLTTGTFDGVHIGHQKLLSRIRNIAKKTNGESVLLTFHPHPRLVLFPDDTKLELITTQKEKLSLLEKEGIDHLIIHPFTKDFSRISSVDFVRGILVNKIGVKKLVIGYNHHFGRNREGSLESLKEHSETYGFEVEEISALEVDEINVSSTKIREALHNGDISVANSYLGHEYSFEGIVTKGKGIGSQLGYATANIEIDEKHKLLPKIGVYAVVIEVEGTKHKGMLNIGFRPTLSNSKNYTNEKTIEVHIFDFNKHIYEKSIQVVVFSRIREEIKFPGIKQLIQQLTLDKQSALDLLQSK